jgi:hypothetical protein
MSIKAENVDVNVLLKTIEEQNKQQSLIQNKFKDLTHAYKSLLAEKKALETTLKTLKSTDSNEAQSNKSKADKTTSESDESSSEQKEDKLALLTSNMQVIIETKSKMESTYIAEKKILKVFSILTSSIRLSFIVSKFFFLICLRTKLRN